MPITKPSSPGTLLVLGAGASIGAHRYPVRSSSDERFSRMPSSRDFFFDLFSIKSLRGRRGGALNYLGLMYEGVEKLVRRAWGRPLEDGFAHDEWRGINVEEVLTFVDIGARMHTRGTSYARAFRDSRECLLQFINVMLLTRSYGQHCELLCDILFQLRSTDSIISFNYDTIADFSVQHAALPQFRAYKRLLSGATPNVSEFVNRGVLLKLHGSVNWQQCTSRGCQLRGRPRLALDTRERKLVKSWHSVFSTCDSCGAKEREPAIIPPMSDKGLARRDFFQRMWMIARAQLPRFDEIVFVGYSFPPNDSYSDWLFRQLRFAETKPPRIVVANPEALKRRSLTRSRYDSLFGGFDISYHRDLEELASNWKPINRAATA